MKGEREGKRKNKGKGKGKGKDKVGKPSKLREMEGSCEGSGSIDDMNEDEVPKDNFRGLSDIKEYDSNELPHEYDFKDDEVLNDYF